MTDALLLEQVVSAHRERGLDGRVQAHPAWHDLDADGRREAWAEAVVQRRLEAALAPDGRSSTVAAVLGRIALRR